MGSSLSLARTFSLRVPITTEAERAQFQQRLGTTLFILFGLSMIFFVVQLGTLFVAMPSELGGRLRRRVDEDPSRQQLRCSPRRDLSAPRAPERRRARRLRCRRDDHDLHGVVIDDPEGRRRR